MWFSLFIYRCCDSDPLKIITVLKNFLNHEEEHLKWSFSFNILQGKVLQKRNAGILLWLCKNFHSSFFIENFCTTRSACANNLFWIVILLKNPTQRCTTAFSKKVIPEQLSEMFYKKGIGHYLSDVLENSDGFLFY